MSSTTTDTNDEIIQKFLENNDALIVDSNSSARVSLTGTLVQLGAKRNKLSLVGSMTEARAEITRLKPRIIFCDFMVGSESGLDLIQQQKQEYGGDGKKCLFVLVTGNVNQSNVARAAEEDVDTFVIKPYTLQNFRKCIGDALRAKLHPTDYATIIDEGKELLISGKVTEAHERFSKAKKLQDKPTLACFYEGQTELLEQALDEAKGSYREGLSHNKIHYKCLIGLYDLLMSQKKYTDAYDVVKKLAQYFPANPKRLASVLRLAIMTNNYDDIEGYYRVFTQLDERSDELVRYICSALSITGKYYLSRSTRSRGLELFEKVATSCAGRIQFMRYAVETMVGFDCVKEAEAYLSRFPAELRGQSDYLVASLLVAGASKASGEVIQIARGLLSANVEQPMVYLTLIHHLAKVGHQDPAETQVQNASKKWPDRADEFLQSLKDGLEKRTEKAA